ncbi:DUF261 family protein (plasmid) [Entomospira entomophila]|uniref:DUF261 family protein n=1 Tax=Entomospira entomophila TaxID=2719988 RepID=A0A968GD67_9SPIO|nr:DUF261 family protein [Entomospira entomophilus]NIZ41423.1 DUF261 family protein [Entomospira entomophilus]WDI36373.1 DUF261 family protein [Entomospira entomophilus]
MIKQNDPTLRSEIQSFGCNFLAHLAMHREDWQAYEIEDIYQRAVARGIIDSNCKVQQPQDLLALIGSDLRQIGGVNLLAPHDRWGVKESDARVQFRIARWSQRHSRHQHFTLYNQKGELYDPFDARMASYSLEREQLMGYQFYG